jgi:hypothetical protein
LILADRKTWQRRGVKADHVQCRSIGLSAGLKNGQQQKESENVSKVLGPQVIPWLIRCPMVATGRRGRCTDRGFATRFELSLLRTVSTMQIEFLYRKKCKTRMELANAIFEDNLQQ